MNMQKNGIHREVPAPWWKISVGRLNIVIHPAMYTAIHILFFGLNFMIFACV